MYRNREVTPPSSLSASAKTAFTLVELSIVLVILGLLVGGILSGQSLIRASELKAVTTEYQRYVTAVASFRDKYFALPGDMANAESFWGQAHAVDATCRNTQSTTALTCNGDGDGNVETITTRSREIYRFWQHLASAKLIEGQYDGSVADATTNWAATPGINSPKSKMSKGGWSIVSATDAIAQGGWYALMFPPQGVTHWLEFGTTNGDFLTGTPLLRSEEAWNIDSKMDDGLPGQGKITTFNHASATTDDCASTDVATTAVYQLDKSTKECALLMGF